MWWSALSLVKFSLYFPLLRRDIVKLLVRGMLRTNFIGFLLLEKVPIRDE